MKSDLLTKVIRMSRFFVFVVAIQTLFASLIMATENYAQKLESTIISTHWLGLSLEKAFVDIQRQTDLYFTYTYETIDNIRVSNRNNNLRVSDLLKILSGQTGLGFVIQDDLVYVYSNQKSKEKTDVKWVKIPTLEDVERHFDQLDYAIIYQVSTDNIDADSLLRGSIKGDDGSALIGATIIIEENGKGTVSDSDGSFAIKIPSQTDSITLSVSYVGYMDQKLAVVDGQNEVDILLTEHISELDEVVVIGYGTGTKEKFNGAVSKIETEKLNTYATANFDQAIVGTIAGLQISGNNKNPGENSVIQIRGLNTLTAGTNPLIVIDGIPLTEGASLSAINTQDIASISILKDAASAAIYGSRASNGVILITTKTGQEGAIKVTYDGYVGFQKRVDNFELADAYSTARFDYDARNFGYLSGGPDRNITDNNAVRDANGGGKRARLQPFLQAYLDGQPGLINTSWIDEVLGAAIQQNHYLNFSGGTAKSDYTISLGYFDADNIVVDADYRRYTTNFRLNANPSNRIRFGISSNLAFSDANPVGSRAWSDFNLQNAPDPAFAIILMHPYYSPYNEDGSLAVATQLEDNNENWDGPISGNALATMEETANTEQAFRLFGSLFLEVEPLDGLKFKTSFGGDYSDGVTEFFAPSTLGRYRIPVANSMAIASKTINGRENFITENVVTYDRKIARHTFNVLGGHSYQQELRNFVRLEGQDFTDDNLRNISGATNPIATHQSSKWSLISFFTRLQYDFANRYSISGSFRRDGSSRFGANTKYGNFSSLSTGWTLSNESFFPQDGQISFAKLRFSWGQTGNNQIGDFASIAVVNEDNYLVDGSIQSGSYISTSPNPDLSWETNTALNVGVDLGFFNNKLLLTAEYYTSNTTDLLLNVPVPQQSGFSRSLQNIGELNNKGLEFELRGNGLKIGQLDVGMNANFATTQNKVVALGTGQTQILTNNGGMDFLTRVGGSIAQFYTYEIVDVYRSQAQLDEDPIRPLAGTEVGDYVVKDINGDGQITPDDRTILGDYNPDFTYGFGCSVAFKGFDLHVQFNGVEGRKATDRMLYYAESGEGFFVPTQYYVDNYFTDGNLNGFFRRPDFSSFSSAGRLTRSSSLSVYEADYFRLRSLQFGYTIPLNISRSLGIENCRIYITGNNLFNITNFRGYNPDGIDTRSNNTQTLSRGWINSTSPTTRFLAFGVNFNF